MKLNWIESKVWAWICELARLPRGCFVKIQTIADRFNYKRRRIEMCIRKFKDAGMLIAKRRGPTSSQYFVKEFEEKQLSLFPEDCVSFCASTPISSEVTSERVESARKEAALVDVSHIRSTRGRFAASSFWRKIQKSIQTLDGYSDDEVNAYNLAHGLPTI
jgi:hypothetical protein